MTFASGIAIGLALGAFVGGIAAVVASILLIDTIRRFNAINNRGPLS